VNLWITFLLEVMILPISYDDLEDRADEGSTGIPTDINAVTLASLRGEVNDLATQD